MSSTSGGRPDPATVMRGLKDFQRDTVEYVFRRMYLDADPVHRFLIADEVGLGKTMVARGLVAKVLDHLWDSVKRIDVVYICSNAEIARQNVLKLNVTDRTDAAITSRITLLPIEIDDLADSKVNLVSFTPSTSLDLKSALGTYEERALLYWMLKGDWGLQGAGPKNVLQGNAGAERFRRYLAEFRDSRSIDPSMQSAFVEALKHHGVREATAGRPDLKTRFLEQCERFARVRQEVPSDDRDAVREVVGQLRSVLASTCVRSLQPDLIILDEFQRFKHLLGGETDASLLARDLFEYSDEQSKARVLLLSATPYKMYTLSDEADDDHYVDFLRTAQFLLHHTPAAEGLDDLLTAYRQEIYKLGSAGIERMQALKTQLEHILRSVMVRTERLATSADRDGMLVEATRVAASVAKRDPLAYRALQRVAVAVDHADTLEYWKAAPYVLNFMDDYKLKESLKQEAKGGKGEDDLTRSIATAQHLLLPWADVTAYRSVDPGNARLRWLYREVLETGAWRLLWVPPAAPYYVPSTPFDAPQVARFTKRLIFSAWRVVPKVIAALVSYEAERQMMASAAGNETLENTPEARKRRRGLLQFSKSDGREVGMPVLGMLYPAIVLARECDPLVLAQQIRTEGRRPSQQDLMDAAASRIAARLAPFLASAPESGPEDEKWYWAAPIMLDRAAEPEATSAWFGDADLASKWAGDSVNDEEVLTGEEGDSTLWSEHVRRAKYVASGVEPLGRPPADLARVLAILGLGGPAVCALRALCRMTVDGDAIRAGGLRQAAGRIAWAARSLFNVPEVIALVRGLNPAEPYWLRVLEYGAAGCIQAVLDEYVHMLYESRGLGSRPWEDAMDEVASVVAEALSLRAALLGVDEIAADPASSRVVITSHRMRARFAARLSEEQSEGGSQPTRADQVRTAFNSPFWPFVLATTSVGQEGLDFHHYCHAVVHWNLPSNPVDLEQREGRVHRYKGHAVRRNVAARHQGAGLPVQGDPWQALFAAAASERPEGATDLVPYWVYPTPGGARIERHVPAFPLSHEVGHLEALRRSLAVYRMVFGQPRQEDLVAYLLQHVPAQDLPSVVASLRIDLSPPKAGIGPTALGR